MKKIALCTGINDYPGTANDLSGCINDAWDWRTFFKNLGFQVYYSSDSQLTVRNFKQLLVDYISLLETGDWFVCQYSGHGTQWPDVNNDELDGYDEALFLYDGPLIDDEIRDIIRVHAKEGVFILFILDSCFSGSATRKVNVLPGHLGKRKFIPPPVWNVKKVNNTAKKKRFLEEISLVDVLMSGCSDNESSYDAFINGRFNGAFTRNAIDSYRAGMTFQQWHAEISKRLPSSDYPQSPQLEGSVENLRKKFPDPMPSDVVPVVDYEGGSWIVPAVIIGLVVIGVVLYFVLR